MPCYSAGSWIATWLTSIQQAEDLFCQFVEQMAAQGGITEQLKEDDQMRWVGFTYFIQSKTEKF